MTKDVGEMRDILVSILKEHKGLFKITSDTHEKFEVTGTKPAMQGKKKVDGFYFSTVIRKAKDCRFYFFPAYTHKEELGEIPSSINKMLKGKSCFHIKYIDEEVESDLRQMVERAVEAYQKSDLL